MYDLYFTLTFTAIVYGWCTTAKYTKRQGGSLEKFIRRDQTPAREHNTNALENRAYEGYYLSPWDIHVPGSLQYLHIN
jgi:hypothetical protein